MLPHSRISDVVYAFMTLCIQTVHDASYGTCACIVQTLSHDTVSYRPVFFKLDVLALPLRQCIVHRRVNIGCIRRTILPPLCSSPSSHVANTSVRRGYGSVQYRRPVTRPSVILPTAAECGSKQKTYSAKVG
jgi:hypothetical protein